MDLRTRAVKGVAWNAAGNWGGQALSFVVLVVLARLLGPEAYGTIALAGVYVALLRVLLSLGLNQALVQRAALGPTHRDTAFWVTVVMGIGLAVQGVLTAHLVARLFGHPDLAPILAALSLMVAIEGFGIVQVALIRRELLFKTLSLRRFLSVLAGGVVGVGAALAGFGVWALVLQQAAQGAVGTLVMWIATDWRPAFRCSWRDFSELFRFGRHVLGFNALSFMNRRADIFLVGYLLGPAALGFYSVARRANMMLAEVFGTTIGNVAMPTFSRMEGDRERIRSALYTATRMTCLFAFPAFVGLAVLAHEVVSLLLGDTWLEAVPVLRWLAVAGAIQSAGRFGGAVMLAMNKSAWNFGLATVVTVTRVAVLLAVAPLGLVPVSIALAVHVLAMAPISFHLVRKLVGIEIGEYARCLGPPLTGALALLATVTASRAVLHDHLPVLPLVLVLMGAGAVVYVAVVWLCSPRTVKDSIRLARIAMS